MSQAGTLSGSGGGGTPITTIDGDTGSATGPTITLEAGISTQNCGSSVEFVASGSTVEMNVTDANNNTIIGSTSGKASISGTVNTFLGHGAAHNLTSGSFNVGIGTFSMLASTTACQNTFVGYQAGTSITTGAQSNNTGIGFNSLEFITSGTKNIALGYLSGSAYATSDSSNIAIGHVGVSGNSNETRIGWIGGTSSTQTTCFIDGIQGVSVSNTQMVTINTSTGQMGSQAVPGSGSLVLIQSQTASNSAAISFTGITATYKTYMLVITQSIPASASTHLQLTFSTNGGSTYLNSGYISGINYIAFNSGTVNNASSSSLVYLTINQTNSGGACGTVMLYGLTTAGNPFVTGQTNYFAGGGTTYNPQIQGYNTTTSGVNAVQLTQSSGNITSGTFTLFGVLE